MTVASIDTARNHSTYRMPAMPPWTGEDPEAWFRDMDAWEAAIRRYVRLAYPGALGQVLADSADLTTLARFSHEAAPRRRTG